MGLPTVSPQCRVVDLSVSSEPTLVLHVRRGPLELRLLTTVTAFQAPQNIAVERAATTSELTVGECASTSLLRSPA